jgi:thymidylate synthase
MNNIDKQYQKLLQDIIHNGVEKKTRNGGTISVFGRQIRHKMSEGFPLLTTKKMHWKSIVTELLWFLRGDTNIKYLVDNGCHIWDGDAYKNWKAKGRDFWEEQVHGMFTSELGDETVDRISKEEFINKIKTDDEFAKQWGELGPIYGKQWRDWTYLTREQKEDIDGIDEGICGVDMFDSYRYYRTIDQIANLISELKTNPDSRRLMVNAWNVGELDQMVLPPCHYGFQVYTRELTPIERMEYYAKHFINEGEEISMELLLQLDFDNVYDGFDKEIIKTEDTLTEKTVVKWKSIPRRAISLMWNQRSVDTFLGLPFNIASYGLLLEIIAREVNMVPDELIGNLGDVHLYTNHIEQAKEQIGRKYTHDERTEMLKQAMGYENYNSAIKELMPFGGGMSEYYELHKIPKHSKEPFELPTVKITERNWYQHEKVKEHLGEKTFIQKIESYRPEDLALNNYQSHPRIKAPLSN